MDQERFPKPLTPQVRLYLRQRGWKEVREGWVHDHPMFTCKRCVEVRDTCIVTLITPIDGSRGGYRLSTCTECQLKDLACPLISAVVRLRYHWNENRWEIGLLGRRWLHPEPQMVDGVHVPGQTNNGAEDGNDPLENDMKLVKEDFPHDSSSASTAQHLAGQLVIPNPQWFTLDAMGTTDNADLSHPNRPPRGQNETPMSDGSTFIKTIDTSITSDVSSSDRNPQPHQLQLEAVQRYRLQLEVDHTGQDTVPFEPDFWNTENDNQGPPPFDAQFDEEDEAIEIDQFPSEPHDRGHFLTHEDTPSAITFARSRIQPHVDQGPIPTPIKLSKNEAAIIDIHARERRSRIAVGSEPDLEPGDSSSQSPGRTGRTIYLLGSDHRFTEIELLSHVRGVLPCDDNTERSQARIALINTIFSEAYVRAGSV